MVNRPGIVNAQLTPHPKRLPAPDECVNSDHRHLLKVQFPEPSENYEDYPEWLHNGPPTELDF